MGNSTLLEFRARLQSRLGDRDLSEALLNRAVNDGYFDLTGSTDFEELHKTSTVSLSEGEVDVLLPTDLQWLRGVFNDTDKKALVEVDEDYFWTLEDDDDGGEPKYYCRLGAGIRFWPALDDTYVLRINYNKFPDRLSSDSDTTELKPTWDRALDMMATYHALLELGEETRAADWLNKCGFYISTRMQNSDVNRGTHLGVRVVTTMDELQRLGG